jgi:hypothetical protein
MQSRSPQVQEHYTQDATERTEGKNVYSCPTCFGDWITIMRPGLTTAAEPRIRPRVVHQSTHASVSGNHAFSRAAGQRNSCSARESLSKKLETSVLLSNDRHYIGPIYRQLRFSSKKKKKNQLGSSCVPTGPFECLCLQKLATGP